MQEVEPTGHCGRTITKSHRQDSRCETKTPGHNTNRGSLMHLLYSAGESTEIGILKITRLITVIYISIHACNLLYIGGLEHAASFGSYDFYRATPC